MKIALTTTAPNLEAQLDPRFGRCAYVLIVDSETLEFEAHPNPALNSSGGAGIRMAQFVSDLKPDAVISGDFGPNAASALQSAHLPMYLFGDSQSVKDVIGRFKSGKLTKV